MNIEAVTELTVRNAPKPEAVAPNWVPAEKPEAAPGPVPVEDHRTVAARDEEPARETVEQVLGGVNSFLQSSGNHIQFSLHEKAQRMMVQVIDNETQEVVRTFPPKELLDLAARIGEMVGTLIDQTG